MALEFKQITKESYNEIAVILISSAYGRCEYTFGTLLMYSNILKLGYCIDKGRLFIQGKGSKNYFYFCPVVKEDSEFLSAIEEIINYERARGGKAVINAIPTEKSKLVTFATERRLGYADYVYDIRAFSDLKGKKYHGKRNHIARFDKETSEYKFEKITPENLGLVLDFFQKFKQKESKDSEMFRVELEATKTLLNNYFCAPFEGYFLSVNGQVIGFTVAEKQGEFLVVHVEKCDKDFHGVYEKIANLMTKKMIETYPDLKYLNREDDAGDEGLKKAKLSYKPLYMAEKEKLIFD